MKITQELLKEIEAYCLDQIKQRGLTPFLGVLYGSYVYRDDPNDIDVAFYVKERSDDIIAISNVENVTLDNGIKVNLAIRSIETLINQANHGLAVSLKVIFSNDIVYDPNNIHHNLRHLVTSKLLTNCISKVTYDEFISGFDKIEDKRLLYVLENISYLKQIQEKGLDLDLNVVKFYKDNEEISDIIQKIFNKIPLTEQERDMVKNMFYSV